MMKKIFAVVLAACLVGLTAAGCGGSESKGASSSSDAKETEPATTAVVTNLPKLDMSKWQYSEQDGFYYLLGVSYCEAPADEKYEKLAVFVPAAYMDGTKNPDGTYTCKLNGSAKVGGYTASTAPIAMPVLTPSYYAADAITEEQLPMLLNMPGGVRDFVAEGMVYVFPGCRGIDQGAPAGVTDLKAAVRYLRYCDDVIAGDAERIFAFGMSGGGAQAAILGASGDSELYDPYLEKIGAVQGVSDAVAGSMDWCPVVDLGTANAEYEWMMGCTRTNLSQEQKAISDALAAAYADYVNSAGFTDRDGNALTLEKSESGVYQAGSYYEYIKGVIERSLNNYLADTEFSSEGRYNAYDSAQAYIDELNKDKKWITYDKSANTATITSVEDFVKHCKQASGLDFAFDQPDSQNNLFGYGDGTKSHFDRILADVFKKLNVEYASEYETDLAKTDFTGNTVEQRVDMYSTLYYLMKNRGGYGKSNVAKYWRIRTGIEQNNTALTTEVNLALALENRDDVESVDFETVWAQGHTQAEREGDTESTSNFIEWIKSCVG